MYKKLGFVVIVFVFLVNAAFAQQNGVENLRRTSKAFANVAKSVSPSVVFIQVESQSAARTMPFEQSPFDDEFLRRFFGDRLPMPKQSPQSQPRAIAQGSGFVFAEKSKLLSKKTYILTNNHVVKNAKKIKVTFKDGKTFSAKVTGRDPKSDLAVLEVSEGGFKPLPLGDSDKLEVGEWVVALGNPFGLSHTLTVGVVSAKGRSGLGINDYEDFIQTDAAINPGNSGGPLVNLDGEVIGINTAIFSRSGGYMGLGFAIPSNMAKKIAYALIDRGSVERGYLGVVIQPLTSELAKSFALDQSKGILIAQVSKHSPAEKAGLRQGDVVVEYDGKAARDVASFRNRVSLTSPGKTVKLKVMRDGKIKELSVTIGKMSQLAVASASGSHDESQIGITVQALNAALAKRYGLNETSGLVVTKVEAGSIADMGGIKPGAIILQVNKRAVRSIKDFQSAIAGVKSQRRILLLIKQGGSQQYLVLSW